LAKINLTPEVNMITAKLLRDDGILIVSPVDKLMTSDFERIRLLVNPYLKENRQIKGMLIDAEDFPGWEDFTSMLSHLEFVNAYEKLIKRVAVVTNSEILSFLPPIADHFVSADIKHFSYQDRAAALKWLQAE
jgi:hypothetical protein